VTVLTRQGAYLSCTITNGQHHLAQAGFLHLEWPVEYQHNCLLFLEVPNAWMLFMPLIHSIESLIHYSGAILVNASPFTMPLHFGSARAILIRSINWPFVTTTTTTTTTASIMRNWEWAAWYASNTGNL
jgi:hypothetical protein